MYLSFSQSLVEDVSATARNIVKSEDFQNLWPVKISTSTDAKSSWKTTVDGYDAGHVYSASMGGQVTGRRAGTLANEGFTGAIILDDPLKPEDAFSQTARRKANRKILNTVNSRKAKSDTPIILIMQRLHVEDPTNFVLTGNVPGEWEQISIPALIDDEYISKLPEHIQRKIPRDVERDEKGRQSYWPLKESLLSLLQLEKGGEDKDGATVSRYTFASQYMQNPKSWVVILLRLNGLAVMLNYLFLNGVRFGQIRRKRQKNITTFQCSYVLVLAMTITFTSLT